MLLRLPAAALLGAIMGVAAGDTVASPAPAGSGVAGHVRVAPSCPGPARPGQACVAPFAGARLQLRTPAGKLLRRDSAAEDGTFKIAAPPGRYVLQVEVEGLYPRCEPAPLRVVKGRWTRLTLECDSGMR